MTAASPLRVVVSPCWAMSFIILLRRMENLHNRASPVEMHPYPRLRRYFHLKVKRLTTFCALLRSYKMCSLCTPEGEVCSPYCFCSHKHLKV